MNYNLNARQERRQRNLLILGVCFLIFIAATVILTIAGAGNPLNAFKAWKNPTVLERNLGEANKEITALNEKLETLQDYQKLYNEASSDLATEREKNTCLTSENSALVANLAATQDTLNKFRQQIWAAFENAGGKAPATHFCFPGICNGCDTATFDFK